MAKGNLKSAVGLLLHRSHFLTEGGINEEKQVFLCGGGCSHNFKLGC
jgi:hypothetical protein